MNTPSFPRVTAVALAILLTVPLLPAVGAAETNADHLRVVNARTSAAYESIQAALDAALPGDTITVPMSLNASNPTAWLEGVTISKNDIRLCATVAVATCADHSAPGRFESTSGGVWANPPVVWQGQAIKLVGAMSTSHYPNTNNPLTGAPLQLTDVTGLSFDFMVETGGSCGGGSPRIQIGVNLTGDGSTKDGSILAYTGVPCPIGSWKHVDFATGGVWHSPFGGPVATTRANVENFLATTYPNYKIVTYNVVADGSSATTWVDNERFNDAFMRESTDFNCPDPQSPSCLTVTAQGATIIDAQGLPADTIRITATGVTVEGFTIKNTGLVGAGNAIKVSGAASGAVIKNNDIAGSATSPLTTAAQMGVFEGAYGAGGITIVGNNIHDWAHSGVYLGGSTTGAAVVADNVITKNKVNGLLIESGTAPLSITGNDLRTQGNSNVRLNTSRTVELHENKFGVAPGTLDLTRFGYTGVHFDARYNDWGAYTRQTIDSTIVSAAGATIDTSCYYNAGGTAVCPPTAAFTATPSSPHMRVTVSFADQSAAGGNSIASRAWNFGDGATATTTNPTHAYQNSGSFLATLTVTDSEGYSTQATQTIIVTNAAPVFDAIADKTASEGSTLTFAARAVDPDGDAVTYSLVTPPAGATINAGSGIVRWVVGNDQQGARVLTIRATDGDKNATTTVNVTVGNADQAPVLSFPATVNVATGATTMVTIGATDADGDTVVLTHTALPMFATLSGNDLTLAPLVGDHGVYSIVFTATANAVQTTKTMTIKVTGVANATLVRVSAATTQTTPGQQVSLVSTITNTGPNADTFAITATAPVGWTLVAPSPIALAPGESQTVTVLATGPVGQSSGIVKVTATSAVNTTVARSLSWTVSMPIFATITPDAATLGLLEAPTGVVKVTYLDGSPVVNAPLRVDQIAHTLPLGITTSVTGRTDANGEFAYSFEGDAAAMLPGTHTLKVIAILGATAQSTSSYSVEAI